MLSVKALLQAAEVSKTGNADRLKEGVDELRLDYNLMMFSAICNAVQTVTGCEHITYPRVNEILGIEYWTGKKILEKISSWEVGRTPILAGMMMKNG